ncbi:hypothetical protein, partial [Phytopseudomonas flavescens]|uniref:hypothetical protein n=1 Tax=Phytopseudomonas flavescens TaxID=29435 RepID=UPI001ABFB3F5
LGVTRWEAAPRLGLDAWTTKFASGDTVGAKGTGNITAHAADDIRFSQNTVSFNKTDRVTGTNYTYNDLVQRIPQGQTTIILSTSIVV